MKFLSKKDRKIKNQEAMIRNRDEIIINLIDEIEELKYDKKNMELNIEFLRNNLSPIKKKALGMNV